MRLTNYSDYALRSLIYLAVRPDPSLLANISDIADSYGISKSETWADLNTNINWFKMTPLLNTSVPFSEHI